VKKISITIKTGAKPAHVLQEYMAEKASFKAAAATGTVSSFVKKSGKKFDSPVSIGTRP